MQNLKVVALVSGGKDSTMNMLRCVEQGHEIVCLGNLFPAPAAHTDELDSFMYQTVGHDGIEAIAACMELPLFRRPIQPKGAVNQELEYTPTAGDEVEDLFALLHYVKQQHPGVNAVATGAILSNYQRTRVEAVCMRLGLVSLAFLWQCDQTELLDEMIAAGVEARLIKVACMGLSPQKHLGMTLEQARGTLHRLNAEYGAHVCGEGGEFETFTTDCPLYKSRINMHDTNVVLHSDDEYAPVGYLKCGSWRVEPKAPRTWAAPAQVHLVTDEDAATVARLEPAAAACGRERASAPSEANRPADTPSLHCGHGMLLLAARTARDVAVSLAVSRAEGVAVKTAGDPGMAMCGGTACEWASVAEEAEQILEAIEVDLREAGMTWQQVSMVGVYLHDMADFAAVNEVYARHLPMRTPAARLCVALHALPTTTRSAAGEQDRRGGERVAIECSAWPGQQTTLHVQSVSRWAPSNIGPYSQAKTLAGRLVFVSGQIGLDPASMSLVDKSVLSQGRQCLRNLQAILGACDSSLSRVARATIFVTSMSDAEELLALWRLATQDHSLQAPGQQGPKCSVSLVEVAGLPRGALVEYQVTALTNAGGSLEAWGEEEAHPPDAGTTTCNTEKENLGRLPDTGCDDDPSVGCKAVQCVATGCGQEGAREGAREERWCAATLACTCTRLATDDKEIARAGLLLGRRVLDCLRAHGLTAEDLVSLRLLKAAASDTTQTAAANEGKGTTARAGATTGEQALIAALRDAVLDCLHASSVTRGHGTAEAGRRLGRGAATNGGGGRRQVTVMPVRRLAIPGPATANDSPLPVQLLLEMLAFGGG